MATSQSIESGLYILFPHVSRLAIPSPMSEACKAKLEQANAKKATKGSAKMGKEEGTHAQPGAQPLTKKACETAGLKWNDQSNVCGG